MRKTAPKKDISIPLVVELIERALLDSKPDSLLWVADEHPITQEDLAPLKGSAIRFISNRIDQFKLAAQAGLNAQYSDFSFDEITPDQISHIFFRVAKERALVHQVINQAFRTLPLGGTLWLAGFKNEGIKTHIAKASQLFQSRAKVTKGKSQLSVASITKASEEGKELDNNNYSTLRQLTLSTKQTFWTKPGIYGWDKIDQGSLFLKETLASELNNLNDKQVLDLGCGYGYLSCYLAKLNPKKIVATDNCAAAIQATKRNLQIFQDAETTLSEVIASNAGDSITESFDLIICNPPFHQGFATNDNLHKKFLENTRRRLKPNGQAWYVVNQFLPIEKHCAISSLQCKEMARNNSFKIFLIQH